MLDAPLEIERKYLISMPDIEKLKNIYSVTCIEILQTYLKSKGDCEKRIRRRCVYIDAIPSYSYYYTEKVSITGLKRVEIEKEISKQEYLDYLMYADSLYNQIKKDRYCFAYCNQYIELDVYPFWSDKAIVEVELESEEQVVNLPPEFDILEEVTEDKRYKNKALAKEHNL